MEPAGLRSGAVVESTAGRDCGRIFIVLSLMDGGRYALTADGVLRHVSRPKKKNVKHLRYKGMVGESLLRKLENGRSVSDQEVREALAAFEGSSLND